MVTSILLLSLAVQGSVILHGKVVMADGSAPPKAVGTVRLCSDGIGTAPGPLTDKDGSFIWTLQNDVMAARRCVIEATLSGYQSSQVEISNINPALGLNVDLKPITLSLKGGDPYMMGGDDKDIPGKGRKEWDAAMKALTTRNTQQAVEQLKAATSVNPKFALAWHNLGILQDSNRNLKDAREAYTKAIEADPKLLVSYVALTRLMIAEKDWPGVIKTTTAFVPQDKNRMFAEMHLHQAVAHYKISELPKPVLMKR